MEILTATGEPLAALLLELADQHFRAHAARDTSYVLAGDWKQTYLHSIYATESNSRHRFALAMDREQPVGFSACWWRREPLLEVGRVGLISDLYVTPGERGKGVGRALAEDALGWFQTQDVRRVDLTTPVDEDASAFWERIGFVAHSSLMTRRIVSLT